MCFVSVSNPSLAYFCWPLKLLFSLCKHAKICLSLPWHSLRQKEGREDLFLPIKLLKRLNCYSNAGLTQCIYSVNISTGASGSRYILLLVQEVLSKLKSMSPAKEGKSFLLLPKKRKKRYSCCIQTVFGNLQFPVDKENTRWVHCNYFLYAHAKTCSFIYVLHRRELCVSLS